MVTLTQLAGPYLALLRSHACGYATYAVRSVDDILPMLVKARDLVENGQQVPKVDIGGHLVKIGCTRLLTYTKGLTCVFCENITVECFAVQSNSLSPHLNAYGVYKDGPKKGNIGMMTSDHIIPRARGGSDELFNRQPSCEYCNVKKSDKLPWETASPRMIADQERSLMIRVPPDKYHPEDPPYVRSNKRSLEQHYKLLRNMADRLFVGSRLGAPDLFSLDGYVRYLCRKRFEMPKGCSTLLAFKNDKWSHNLFEIGRIIRAVRIAKQLLPEFRRLEIAGLL